MGLGENIGFYHLVYGFHPAGVVFSPCPFIRSVKKARIGKMGKNSLLIVDTD